MKKFEEPSCEVIYLENSIIVTSTQCGCFDGTQDWGEGSDSQCPNLNLAECGCKLNTTDPSLGNCV
jgi:hypothetical protein